MTIKFNLTLTLLWTWLGLILVGATTSSVLALRMGQKSLVEVDKAEVLQHQSVKVLSEGISPKLIRESEILMKVENYRQIQKEDYNNTAIEALDAPR
ncbi:hypothetical protein [Gloeocapsa sp. PCC 73106]|uniref:hypothetical protein n=1 Tax=Gloeocapsa sp. PCC 73106 TaxID=102232 RepID=UPI0002ABD7AF|nr:hypothetical protein [Gloeocapsa sp. PCC 73106]ELR98012.1 hypothetical protein GLO73106DRAFT_00018330 [Gloeocapsa sp. PCC 73106]